MHSIILIQRQTGKNLSGTKEGTINTDANLFLKVNIEYKNLVEELCSLEFFTGGELDHVFECVHPGTPSPSILHDMNQHDCPCTWQD